MSKFANKFNRKSFNINTEGFNFVKLADRYKKGGADLIHPINGFYVHKTKMGDSAVAIDEKSKELVNLPMHLTETVREILSDEEAVDLVKASKVGFTIYEYTSHGKKCYSINFVDL